MKDLHSLLPSSTDIWLRRLLDTPRDPQTDIICCTRAEIERRAGWARFEYELKRRGFYAVENGPQVVILQTPMPTSLPA